MIYNYRAVSNKGEIVRGSHEGENIDEILDIIRNNGYIPINIKMVKKEEIKTKKLFQTKIQKKDISIFCRQFYTMLEAGIGVINCLDTLEKQTENKLLKKTIGQVQEEVEKGNTLSESMKKHREVFPDLFINMVEAGEISGSLEIILKRMALYYEKEYKIETKTKGALIYPLILIIVSIFVVIFLLTMVLPTFIGMFENNDVTLPVPTRILLKIGYSFKKHWHIYLISLLIFSLFIKIYKETYKGRIFLDRLKIGLPGIQKFNSKIITSRFTRTLSTLLSSGIPLIQSLEIVNKTMENEVVMEKLNEAIESIERGLPLWKSIENMNIFPPLANSMINVGEESGSLIELLYKTADFYEDEVDTSLETMTTIIEPILIIIMAFIIGFIVIAMAMPIFDMVNTIEF